MSANDVGWDIGGYVPSGYKVTPWVKLFPALAAPPSGTTQRGLRKFGQYDKW
jgi:hypothetical protein